MELMIGCGRSTAKRIKVPGHEGWTKLVRLDINPDVEPDVVHDLSVMPLPFEDDTFGEIHAYDVLEHCGSQGDFRFFFRQWEEFWRIMKPDGLFYATVPTTESPWALGDPSHTRIIPVHTLKFLSQDTYVREEGTNISDFRWIYKADFDIVHAQVQGDTLFFLLRCVKPSRLKR